MYYDEVLFIFRRGLLSTVQFLLTQKAKWDAVDSKGCNVLCHSLKCRKLRGVQVSFFFGFFFCIYDYNLFMT